MDILTVDLEDWFHVLDPEWSRPELWSDLESHVEQDARELLDLLDRHQATATFFVVGWLAERKPDLIREIVARGHTLASHGYHHVPPVEMSQDEFRRDLMRSIEILEELGGRPVRGYRAPGFGVRRCAYPYRAVLRECGIRYDASRFPGVFPGRRSARAHRWLHRSHPAGADDPFWDVPVSSVRAFGLSVVFAGGGFLRLLPAWLVRWCARRVHAQGQPLVSYVHPRDLNPRSPRVQASAWRRWRYYGGRRGMKRKLESLLRCDRFVSVEEYLERQRA